MVNNTPALGTVGHEITTVLNLFYRLFLYKYESAIDECWIGYRVVAEVIVSSTIFNLESIQKFDRLDRHWRMAGRLECFFFVRQRLYADDTVWWQIASRSPTIKRMIFDCSQTPENYQNYYSLLLPLCHTNQFYLGGQDSWRIRIIKKRLRLCRVKGIKSTSSQNIFMFRCRRHRKKKM